MTAKLIATTHSRDLQPLVTAGQSTLDVWRTLSTLLTSRLSAQHAALLAEPVPNPTRGETDWYCEGDGVAAPLISLPPDQREAARSVLDQLVGDIQALIERLRSSRSDSERSFADLLALAMRIPGESSIYVEDARPVLVAWGHARSGPGAESVELRGRQIVPPGPMVLLPAPPPAFVDIVQQHLRALTYGLLAASLVLLLLAVFLLIRDPFGWFQVEAACRAQVGQIALLAQYQEQAAQGDVLRGALADITRAGGQRRQMCAPLPPPAAAPSDDVRRAQEHGAHAGRLQIILAWNDLSDLDLHVICPSGAEIGFNNPTACGGHLDLDANCNNPTDTPVENVYFDHPPPGRYQVVVDPYQLRPPMRPESNFRITIHREGQADQVVQGVAKLGQHMRVVTQVEVPSP